LKRIVDLGALVTGVGDGGALVLLPPFEVNSGNFEIIWALNFGGDLFLEITPVL